VGAVGADRGLDGERPEPLLDGVQGKPYDRPLAPRRRDQIGGSTAERGILDRRHGDADSTGASRRKIGDLLDRPVADFG